VAGPLCIIGTSQIGAIYTAYARDHASLNIEVDFFGCPGTEFENIRVERDRVAGWTFSNRSESRPLPDYAAIVVCGGLMSPQLVALHNRNLTKAGFSSQVAARAIQDMNSRHHAQSIRTDAALSARSPAYALSNPTPLDGPAVSQDEYDFGVAVIKRILGESRYIQHPAQMLRPGYRGKPEHYRGSVAVDGSVSGAAGHERGHLNEVGGRLVLARILQVVGGWTEVSGNVALGA
jgi:hypothetical protein